MPKSDILPLRRWPCWPGPYSRLLTGLLGRPKTFSPMRRSSLYLALLRLLMFGPICLVLRVPEPHRPRQSRTRPPLHRGAGPIAKRRTWRRRRDKSRMRGLSGAVGPAGSALGRGAAGIGLHRLGALDIGARFATLGLPLVAAHADPLATEA